MTSSATTPHATATATSLNRRPLWAKHGGAGSPLLVLLHGLGCCASVWDRLIPLLDAHWPGRWIAPDLRGHGHSFHQEPYTYSTLAADVASLVKGEDDITILGHSMGGAVGMLLATGQFGVTVRGLVAFSVKLDFDQGDVDRLHKIARGPVRWFDSEEEAIDRYLKVSGLKGLVDPASDMARGGVVKVEGKFSLAMDPKVNYVVGSPLDPFIASLNVPVHLLVGADDKLVSFELMRQCDPNMTVIPGLGHNLHVEAAAQLWQHVEPFVVSR
ncbi:MAG: alpha/beta hydrolase [Burkholderiaceae bacterium]|nr:MAG: alpha/beta hydrolase [Burkholderiaceae bacterium]